MTGALDILACGPASSIQDGGRPGVQRYGVSPAGAMDRAALAAANALVGAPAMQAGLEFCLQGGQFRVADAPVLVAVVGAPASLDGRPAPPLTSFLAQPGQTIGVGFAERVYAYLAVAGGFDRAPDMGSLSQHRRSGLGGAPPAAGGSLAVKAPPQPPVARRLAAALTEEDGPIRVIPGPQDDLFTGAGLTTLVSAEFTVSPLSDRMGVRLQGPALEHAKGYNIVSDGIVAGHIQVPGDGQPIVLMRDRQTTGGYPKIATVITADLDRFARTRPGESVRFRAVSLDEALAALRARAAALEALARAATPLLAELTAERLLAANLIDGVVDGGAG